MPSRSQMRVRIMTPPFGAAARRLIATSFSVGAEFETSSSDNFSQAIL